MLRHSKPGERIVCLVGVTFDMAGVCAKVEVPLKHYWGWKTLSKSVLGIQEIGYHCYRDAAALALSVPVASRGREGRSSGILLSS